jgi:thiamine kinase-like enzyme
MTAHEHDRAALDGAEQAAIALGVPADGAVIIRRAAATSIRLRAANALVRLHPAREVDVAEREVTIARTLADTGAPGARLVPGSQPVVTDSGPATVWHWLDKTGSADLPALARVASRLHAATRSIPAAAEAPRAAPLAAARRQLSAATDPDSRVLVELIEQYGRQWETAVADDPLGHAIVHGDLHRNNVVVTDGGPHLVDFELAGVGPCSYDLAAIAVAGRRYGDDPVAVDAAFAAYGTDPRTWDGFAVLCDVYELWVTSWAVAHRQASRGADAEARRRMSRWRTGRSAPWTLA